MELSKSQVSKIGKQIRQDLRDGKEVNEESLINLQKYRESHFQSLHKVFGILSEISRKSYKGSLTVYRLKRIDTIIRKIVREPTMGLATMQDIAGCRVIVGHKSQIKKIVQGIENRTDLQIIKRYDYIAKPRETGYSSYHIIILPNGCDRVVEVQIRTRANHHWATLVEITDLLFNVKLKEGQPHPELFIFHSLLSIESQKLSLNQRESIIKIEKNLLIISKLISVFKHNYFIAVDRWGRSIQNDEYRYVIMEIDDRLSPSFEFFLRFEDAELKYFQKFTIDEPNMVLIHLNNVDFEKIGLAYSNYILTSHPSINLYLEIIQKTILDYSKGGMLKKATFLYEYYDKLIVEVFESFDGEVISLREKLDTDEVRYEEINNHSKYHEIMDHWLKNFGDRFNDLKKKHNSFIFEYSKEKKATDSIIKRLINVIIGN